MTEQVQEGLRLLANVELKWAIMNVPPTLWKPERSQTRSSLRDAIAHSYEDYEERISILTALEWIEENTKAKTEDGDLLSRLKLDRLRDLQE